MSDWDYPFQNSYILNEAQWEEWEPNMHGVPDGVKRGVYGEFEVTPASSGLVVNVAGGVAVVRGFYCRRGSAKPLTLQPPDTQNPRIDLVVLRRSISGGGFARMVITGDPAANPTAPNPAQDNDNWDLPLAEIYVAANAQSLDAGDITDRRVWTSGLDEHLEDTGNPHRVTTAQIGAATAADLQVHKDDHSNPHQVTYDQVGAAPASHTHSRDAVDGWTAPRAATSTLDWNSLTDPGWQIWVIKGTNPHGNGLNYYYYALVVSHGTVLMQIAFPYGGSIAAVDRSGLWLRTRYNGVWTAWRLYGGSMIYGSNANGAYIRYPDGMQICWWSGLSVEPGTTSTWTYPAAFVAAPVITATGHEANMQLGDYVTTTYCTIRNDSGSTKNAHTIAIGRWK